MAYVSIIETIKKCKDAHKDLIKIFRKYNNKLKISFNKKDIINANIDVIDKEFKCLSSYIDLTDEDLDTVKNAILNNSRMITTKDRTNGISIAKFISNKVKSKRYEYGPGTSSAKYNNLQDANDCISRMIQCLPNTNKSNKVIFDVEINFDIDAFFNIGEYNVDSKSCLKHNVDTKLKLIKGKNTFIVLIKRGKIIEGRAIGILSDKQDEVYITNFYGQLFHNNKVMKDMIATEISKKILKSPVKISKKTDPPHDIAFYKNKDAIVLNIDTAISNAKVCS